MERVAIIRGTNLNKFEMQNYEPLTKYFDITGYTTYNHRFEIDYINFKIKKLHCIEEFTDKLPIFLRATVNLLLYKYGYTQYMFNLEKELRDKDIAHAAEIRSAYSYQAVKAKKANNKLKVVLTVWENIPFLSLRVSKLCDVEFNRKITEEIIRNTDAFIAITNRAKDALILEGVPEEKVHVIPVGVDIERFKHRDKDLLLLKQLNIAEDELVLLFVGRIVWSKGIYFLLYAYKKLLSDPEINKNIKLIIVGSGPEKSKIIDIISRLNLANQIILIDSVSYMDIHKLYNISDIFILPSVPTYSWQEQFGMVLVEAMASELPVITTLSGSIPEVVGDAGVLVQPGDFLDLYNKIKELITSSELRKTLGKKARNRVEKKFNPKIVSEKIRKVYSSVLEK